MNFNSNFIQKNKICIKFKEKSLLYNLNLSRKKWKRMKN